MIHTPTPLICICGVWTDTCISDESKENSPNPNMGSVCWGEGGERERRKKRVKEKEERKRVWREEKRGEERWETEEWKGEGEKKTVKKREERRRRRRRRRRSEREIGGSFGGDFYGCVYGWHCTLSLEAQWDLITWSCVQTCVSHEEAERGKLILWSYIASTSLPFETGHIAFYNQYVKLSQAYATNFVWFHMKKKKDKEKNTHTTNTIQPFVKFWVHYYY